MTDLLCMAKLAVLKLHELPAMPRIYVPIPIFDEGTEVEVDFGSMTQNKDVPITNDLQLIRGGFMK